MLSGAFSKALLFLDPVVAAVFALELAVNCTIPSLLRLGDFTNIHTMALRTDNSHSWKRPDCIKAAESIKLEAVKNLSR